MSISRRLLLGALLSLVVFVFSFPLLMGKSIVDDPAIIDISFNFMPNLHWMAHDWSIGEFPLWNPHVVCGMPHLGYSHSGGLYPVAIILLNLFDYIWAGSAIIIVHALLAALLFFLVLDRLGAKPPFAAAGALTFVFSGFFFGLMNETWMLGSTCGLLALWLSTMSLADNRTLLAFACVSLSTAWCALAGDVELMVYGLMGLTVFFGVKLAGDRRELLRSAFPIVLAVAAGCLIASALELTTLETVRYSIRGPQMPYKVTFINMADYWPYFIPTWLAPFSYYKDLAGASAFNKGLSPAYQGGVMAPLIIWALFASVRNRGGRPLAAAWVSLAAFALLRQSEMTGWIFDWVPLVKNLQYTAKSILMIHALGIALGFRNLSVSVENNSDGPDLKAPAIILFVSGAAMILFQPLCLKGPERYLIGALGLFIGAAGIFPFAGKKRVTARAAALAICALAACEVTALAWRHIPRTDPQRWEMAPGLKEFAAAIHPGTRYVVFEPLLDEHQGATVPVFGLFETASGACNVVGPPRIPPARTFQYLSRVFGKLVREDPSGEKILTTWSMANAGTIERGHMHLLNLAGTSLVLARDMSVPFTSPYSLLRPGAAFWTPEGRSVSMGRPGLDMSSPSAIEAPMTSLPGDELNIEALSADDGWLVALAHPKDAGKVSLLGARRLDSGITGRLSGSLASLEETGGSLSLAWTATSASRARCSLLVLEITNPGRSFQRLGKWGATEVFKNRDTMPRVFITHDPLIIKDFGSILDWIDDPSRFRPASQVVLENESREVSVVQKSATLSRSQGRPEGARITHYGPNRVDIEALAAWPGFLVLTDSYYPGWRAYIKSSGDWRETRIAPADLAFRAVYVPEGTHVFRMEYRPLSFEIGLWAGMTSLVLCLAAMAGGIAAGMKRRGVL